MTLAHLRPAAGGRSEVVLKCAGNPLAGKLINGRYLRLRCRDRMCRHADDREKRNGDPLAYDAYHWYDLAIGGRMIRHEFKPKDGGDSVFQEV